MDTVATPEYCQLMACYNAWVNAAFYETIASLSDEERKRDLGVYYKSVHGTLNHLLYGDSSWFGRFTDQPFAITNVGQELYSDFDELRRERIATDAAILYWAESLTLQWLREPLTYRSNVDGITRTLPRGVAVVHFFNHQTHHRGQAHAILSAILGNEATPSFDLIIYQRETGVGLLSSS